jgi:hypothetical protein
MLPDVWFFNPTCDFAVANGTTSWQPNQLLRRMEEEMANLPQFLACSSDIVIDNKLPSGNFLSTLESAGFDIPEFRTIEQIVKDKSLHPQPSLGRILPWGWSPAAHQHLKPLKALASQAFTESPVAQWKESHRELFSRETALRVLKKLIEEQHDPDFMDPNYLPVICRSIRDIEILGKEWGSLMIKMPWSSSGRGLQPVTHFPMHPSVSQRISGMIRDQGMIFAESLLDKVFDLGFLYEITGDKIRFLGYSRFFTGEKGQYKGNYLNGYPEKMEHEVARFLYHMEEVLPELHLKSIRDMHFASVYQGMFGIDTLIFKDNNGKLKINPCLEINWRFTMGHIALALEKRITPACRAVFRTYYNSGVPFSEFACTERMQNPLMLKEGKINKGFLPLTEFSGDKLFGAYLSVSEREPG